MNDAEPRPSLGRKLLHGVVAVALLGAGLLIAKRLIDTAPRAMPEPVEHVAPLVEVVRAVPSTREPVVEAFGTVQAARSARIAAQVGGSITWRAPDLETGRLFEAGARLLEIDPADYELAALSARARVDQAQAQLALTEAEAELAIADFESAGMGEPNALVRREPQLAAARAELELARAALAKAELDLVRTGVDAPFRARVVERLVEVGESVVPGAPLVALEGTDDLEVRLPLSLEEARLVEQGEARVELVRAGHEDANSFPAELVRSEERVDQASRMLAVVARVDAGEGANGTGPPRVGEFVTARIAGTPREGLFVLPRAALRPGPTVWVVDEDDRLTRRAVGVWRTQEDEVWIDAGLTSGERVVTSTLEVAVEGMRLRVAADSEPNGP